MQSSRITNQFVYALVLIVSTTGLMVSVSGCSDRSNGLTVRKIQEADKHLAQGNSLADSCRYDEAEVEYRKALELIPDWEIALDNIQSVRQEKNRRENLRSRLPSGTRIYNDEGGIIEIIPVGSQKSSKPQSVD